MRTQTVDNEALLRLENHRLRRAIRDRGWDPDLLLHQQVLGAEQRGVTLEQYVGWKGDRRGEW